MTANEPPNPAGTWEPDLEAIRQEAHIDFKVTVELVVRAYRRQQAENRIVEVGRDDLDYLINYDGPKLPLDEHLNHIEALAAVLNATEQ